MYVWIALKTRDLRVCVFLCGSCALVMGPASMNFSKFFFKIGSHALFTYLKIILLRHFQFSAISGIHILNFIYIGIPIHILH